MWAVKNLVVYQSLEGIKERTHYPFTLCIAGPAEIVRSIALSQELLIPLEAMKRLGGIHYLYRGWINLPKSRNSL